MAALWAYADFISMACAIVGNQVERGTDRMVNRNLNDGLPAFLVSQPRPEQRIYDYPIYLCGTVG